MFDSYVGLPEGISHHVFLLIGNPINPHHFTMIYNPHKLYVVIRCYKYHKPQLLDLCSPTQLSNGGTTLQLRFPVPPIATKSRRRRGCIRQQTQKLLPVGDHFEGEMFHFTRQKLQYLECLVTKKGIKPLYNIQCYK